MKERPDRTSTLALARAIVDAASTDDYPYNVLPPDVEDAMPASCKLSEPIFNVIFSLATEIVSLAHEVDVARNAVAIWEGLAESIVTVEARRAALEEACSIADDAALRIAELRKVGK